MESHSPCTLHYCSIHALNHSIFLWSPWNYFLPTNTIRGTIIFKIFAAILTTIIRSETFYLFTHLILNQASPFFKSFKYIRFLPKEINPYLPSCIINECNIIQRVTERRYLSWSPYIYMYKLQFLIFLLLPILEKAYSLLFPYTQLSQKSILTHFRPGKTLFE